MAEYIAFDELTHFTQEEYEYLKSRNRPNEPGTRVYMRATANGSSPWCGSAPIGPSADVATVVHGRWEWLGPNRVVTGCMCGTCSACGVRSKYIVNTMVCPNCGARMDAGGA